MYGKKKILNKKEIHDIFLPIHLRYTDEIDQYEVDLANGDFQMASTGWITNSSSMQQVINPERNSALDNMNEAQKNPESHRGQRQGIIHWGTTGGGHIMSNQEAHLQMTLSQEKTYTQIMQEMSQRNMATLVLLKMNEWVHSQGC